jgi:hypothetical protein
MSTSPLRFRASAFVVHTHVLPRQPVYHMLSMQASLVAYSLHLRDNMPPRRTTRRSAGVTKPSTATPKKRSTARRAAARKKEQGEQQKSEAKAPQEVSVSSEELKHRILEMLRGRKEGATC